VIREAISEYFGLIVDGLIHAAVLADGRLWARKTMLPTNLLDIAEIRATVRLPDSIQRLCEAEQDWSYGTDRLWDSSSLRFDLEGCLTSKAEKEIDKVKHRQYELKLKFDA
jgi:hypothetical protein